MIKEKCLTDGQQHAPDPVLVSYLLPPKSKEMVWFEEENEREDEGREGSKRKNRLWRLDELQGGKLCQAEFRVSIIKYFILM